MMISAESLKSTCEKLANLVELQQPGGAEDMRLLLVNSWLLNWQVLTGRANSNINVPKLNVTSLLDAALSGTCANWAGGLYETLLAYITAYQKNKKFNLVAILVHTFKYLAIWP
ncbi:hypothetical protein R1flu_010248 [Riccia fluitans]|uniref:Uncharacterized protein n=1 Tax=Riccia fluitans TaxID=41844 RepID=A0ABD1Z4R9_9MARC